MTTILTVFGCMLALCLAPIVAGAIVAYWKQLFIAVGVLLILLTGLIAWSRHESRRVNDAYNAAHPEEYRRFQDPNYQERKRLADDITLAIHYWRDQGNRIPYKKGRMIPATSRSLMGLMK